MRITRGRLIATVSFLYVITAVVVLTSFRSLTVIEQKVGIVHVHQPEDVDAKGSHVEEKRHVEKPLENTTSRPRETGAPSLNWSTTAVNSNVVLQVYADPRFDDGQPFYCEVEEDERLLVSNNSAPAVPREGDVDFIRLGVSEVYYVGDAYLDMRPGYRSPAIRVLAVLSQTVNASFIVSSMQMCATDSQSDLDRNAPRRKAKHKVEYRSARLLSRSSLQTFAYEFNENHNKPLRGYIVTFELDVLRIRLDTFPTHITLGHVNYPGVNVKIRVRKMMPASFRLEETQEFRQHPARMNQPTIMMNQHVGPSGVSTHPRPNGNAPITANEDDSLRPRYNEWHTQYARAYQHEFAVCVPPLFGTVQAQRLIEFIEMHRILGATRFVFYIYRLHNAPEIESLLSWYAERLSQTTNGTKRTHTANQDAAVKVLRWNMPFEASQIWYHGQLLAIHHCLYENVGISRYAAFIDIDEVIVPRKAASWHELLDDLDYIYPGRQARPAGFRFRGAFFDTSKPGLPDENLYVAKLFGGTKQLAPMTTPKPSPVWPPPPGAVALQQNFDQTRIIAAAASLLDELKSAQNLSYAARAFDLLGRFGEMRFGRLVERNDPSTRVRTKCIVKPDFVFEMGIHHVSKQHVEEMEPRDVEDNQALLNHYRTCEAAFDVTCVTFLPDLTLVSRYKRQLYLKVAESLFLLADTPGQSDWMRRGPGRR